MGSTPAKMFPPPTAIGQSGYDNRTVAPSTAPAFMPENPLLPIMTEFPQTTSPNNMSTKPRKLPDGPRNGGGYGRGYGDGWSQGGLFR